MNERAELGLSSNVSGVQFADVPIIWPRIEHLVDQVVDYCNGEYSRADVYEGLLRRDMQLWVAWDKTEDFPDAIMITQIVCFPQKKFLYIIGLAGKNYEKWVDGWAVVERWALALELNGVRALGRSGLERHKLPKLIGLKKLYSVLGTEFTIRSLQ